MPKLAVVHPPHRFVYFSAADTRQVNLRGTYGTMPHALADNFYLTAIFKHQRSPGVPQYVSGKLHITYYIIYGTVYTPQGGFL